TAHATGKCAGVAPAHAPSNGLPLCRGRDTARSGRPTTAAGPICQPPYQPGLLDLETGYARLGAFAGGGGTEILFGRQYPAAPAKQVENRGTTREQHPKDGAQKGLCQLWRGTYLQARYHQDTLWVLRSPGGHSHFRERFCGVGAQPLPPENGGTAAYRGHQHPALQKLWGGPACGGEL